MSASSRPRRSIAVVALALAVAALSILPAAGANAFSTSSDRGKLLTFINGLRGEASATPWEQQSLLDKYTREYTDRFAACSGCSTPTELPWFTPAPIDHSVLLHAKSASSSGRIAKLEALVSSGDYIYSGDKWGAIGYSVHGDTGYLWIVGFQIGSSDAPYTSLGSGTPTIHGTQRVGTTFTATVPGLVPGPATTTYVWSVTHGSSVMYPSSNPQYTSGAADLGGKVGVTVTQSSTGFAPVTFTASTGKLGHGHFGPAKLVKAGTRVVGQSIEYTVNVEPTPDSMTYTWYRNGVKFTNVGNEYTFTAADKGKRIDVKVVIGKEGFDSVTLRTHTTAKVVGN